MILDSSAIAGLSGVLGMRPLSSSIPFVFEVMGILDRGNAKHPDDDTGAEEHLEAALRHLRRSNLAPACARVLLALVKMTRSPA